MSPSKEKTALIIGHPGHELRVFHWLEVTRPAVFVITDGSGKEGQSRLASTAQILKQTGAREGTFYGAITDAESYAAILNGETTTFFGLTRELAAYLIDHDISYVAGDAMEGYNPTHDVCRLITNAAVEMANAARDREIRNFAFPLTGRPEAGTCNDHSIHLRLDDAALDRKIAAARSYVELQSEVESVLNETQLEDFRHEWLHPVPKDEVKSWKGDKPVYEEVGEERVSAGHYSAVIRYRQHFLPLIEAFRQLSKRGL